MSGRTEAKKTRQWKGSKFYGQPSLPRLPNPSDSRKRYRVIIWIRLGHVKLPAEIVGAAWGGTTDGRWVGGGAAQNVHGVCDRCGAIRRAWDLEDRRGTFGRDWSRRCRVKCEPMKKKRQDVKHKE